MQHQKHVIMIGGCLEQFEQYQYYPDLTVSVLANGNDLKDAIKAGLNCYEADPKNYRQCLDIIVTNQLSVNLYAIFSFIEYGLETAAYLGEALGVLCNPLKPVIHTRNKHLMRLTLSQTCPEISIPYLIPSSKQQIQAFLETHQKIIIKPIDGAGSMGVQAITALNELADIDDNLSNLVCEKYIGGKEYSVESQSAQGLHQIVAITEKYTTEHAPYVELSHIVPARLTPAEQSLIEQSVHTFLQAIGQVHGPAHTEIKLYNGQAYIIESQTRLGGDRIWKLCELATGHNFIRSFVEQVLFKKIYNVDTQHKTAAIKFFAPQPGKLQKISIPKELEHTEGVVDIHIARKVGDNIPPLASSLDRTGFAILSAKNYQALDQLMQNMDTIHLETSHN
ncbi:ATP-grasp domain-containing protein [Zooshikella ganghwensis]|uniref:ATP-grasp domain-containing protein n=1 Tax=Zooshikella ganghwensis TaxID=202772 RepID=A0A4P9VKD8_9GAMM|nr:ATP-grasp domain-containing protein [Zooshikella ganghwensis]RDH43765.1 ATP-grasp domain-containing protein [Zooshikella ganghwensis]